MNAALRAPPDNVPTLTEVVRPSELVDSVEPQPLTPESSIQSAIDEERLALQILWDVGARADALLASGLRTHLKPVLEPLVEQLAEQLVDRLVPVLRAELSDGLADLVRHAVAQEVARSRGR